MLISWLSRPESRYGWVGLSSGPKQAGDFDGYKSPIRISKQLRHEYDAPCDRVAVCGVEERRASR